MANDGERESRTAGWPQHPRLQHGAGRGRERDDLPGGTLDRDRRRGRQRRDRRQPQDEENLSPPSPT